MEQKDKNLGEKKRGFTVLSVKCQCELVFMPALARWLLDDLSADCTT